MEHKRICALATWISLAACVGELGLLEDERLSLAKPYGSAEDLATARGLIAELSMHESWPSFAGPSGLVASRGRHGAFSSVHLNPAAVADPVGLPAGSILAVRSYAREDSSSLESIAAMKRVEGGWFYLKLDPVMMVARDEGGASMAGKITSCADCHGMAAGRDQVFSNDAAPSYGRTDDLLIAAALWRSMSGHETWPPFPNRQGPQTSEGAHGPKISFHLNPNALADPTRLPPGSIVALRSFDVDPSRPRSIVVMQRIAGFAPSEGDWFWLELDAAGNAVNDGRGVPRAGAVTECAGCHRQAAGSDFVYAE